MRQLTILFAIIMLFSCKKSPQEEKEAKTVHPITNTSLERVEPPNWWVGFKNKDVQLLIKENGIGKYTPSINYQGVKIKKVHTARSSNYLFIDLEITEHTAPGKFDIVFTDAEGTTKTHTYELKERKEQAKEFIGFDSSDAVYLITPDRFANANPSNDVAKGMREQQLDRKDNYKRHGGDIEGIRQHLDYIYDLGFTAIWSSPLLTNDMKEGSYHGYAMTDFYEVDPRFGTLEDYQALANDMKKKGMKLIMDQVANHCGLYHWWMTDLPFKDWLNDQENYETHVKNWDWKKTKFSNHRRTTNQDKYAANIDREGNTDGWFVATMPDLNQRNPFMAQYIIQNSIWWIETLQLGGIRQDTYPYPDKAFMSHWAGAIMKEYPNFTIVGEEWSYNPLLIAYWQQGSKNRDGYTSNLKSTMDFAMQRQIVEALNEKESWDKGLVKMYEGLANDFHYPNPKDIMIFPDNHDMSRIFTQLKGNVTHTKMALSYLLTLPRIPQIYYGTEILMDDFEKPGDHGLIRTDFPGGWQGDPKNAFTGKGLSVSQKEMQQYLKKILQYRKHSFAIHEGATTHFAPKDGIYVLSRKKDQETVVHILNKNEKLYTLSLHRFKELGLEEKQMKNVITGEVITWSKDLRLKEKGSYLLTTKLK